MKLLKKYLLLSLVAPLLFSLLSFKSGVGGETVTVRVYENGSNARIVIYANEKTTQVKLENGGMDAARDKNFETISKTLDQYLKAGFKIETSNSAFTGSTSSMTTYILTK